MPPFRQLFIVEIMTTVKLKIKINNSYESEPSSGSGSSISEAHDYDNGERRFPNVHIKLDQNLNSTAINTSATENHSLCGEIIYERRPTSSQESDFEGFSDYQVKEGSFYKTKNQKMTDNTLKSSFYYKEVKKPNENIENKQHIITDFYDNIMIEQNSCNAVDMQISNQNYFANSSDAKQNTSEQKISTELSFNGKINSLNNNFKHPNAISNSNFEISNSQLERYERSPDLFDEEDEDEDEDDDTENVEGDSFVEDEHLDVRASEAEEPINKSLNCPTESSFAEENIENSADEVANRLRKNIKREKEILKRIKHCLSGIPPPPALTIPQLDLFSAIVNNKDEILNYKTEIETVSSVIVCEEESLFKPSHPLDEVFEMPWKETLGVRGHGLCYNICKASESIELLNLQVIERYIGAETSSSYTANYMSSPSSAKKRNIRQKMLTQTAGNNRLSHLAKRRAAFSSANLSTNSLKPQNNFLGGMQILLDNKKKVKSRRKGTTPKRMTPSSKKKIGRKTPSSSARKRLCFRFDVAKPGPSRETSKRALFQSPAKQKRTQPAAVAAPKPTLKPEIANRVEKSKRALFSPDKDKFQLNSSKSLHNIQNCGLGRLETKSRLFESETLDFSSLKRKRSDDDLNDTIIQQSKKMFCHETSTLTPRSLKIKSQSFCVGAGSTNILSNNCSMNKLSSSTTINAPIMVPSSRSSTGRPITKAFSDSTFNTSSVLTENHRKKLLWAVSQALQLKQINVTHASFKTFASVLARVVKRLFQEFFMKSNTSTSDTMLRLAKKYVCTVIAGKSADDIYILAKSKIEEEKKMSTTRLSGYIAPEEFESRKLSLTQSSICSFENTMDSMAFSQNSAMSQTTHNLKNYEDIMMESSKSAIKLSIQPNPSLQKSSSKNNLDGMALRENVDCEQRWSAQKLFTGLDQQNVSPYANPTMRSTTGQTISFKSCLYDLNNSTTKAKRQISFDS